MKPYTFSRARSLWTLFILLCCYTVAAQHYDRRHRYSANPPLRPGYGPMCETVNAQGTPDGHLISGNVRVSATFPQGGLALTRVDANGNVLWARRTNLVLNGNQINGSYSPRSLIRIVNPTTQAHEGYAIAFNASSRSHIARLDENGNVIWVQRLRNNTAISGGEALFISDLIQNEAGQLVFVCESRVGSITRNLYVGHMDINGNAVGWHREFNFSTFASGFSSAIDMAAIDQTADGGYILTARQSDHHPFYFGNSSFFFFKVAVLKIDAVGNFTNGKLYNLNPLSPLSNTQPSQGVDVVQTDDDNDGVSDDGYALSVSLRGADGSGTSPAIYKLNAALDIEWAKEYPYVVNTSHGSALQIYQVKLADDPNNYKLITAAQDGSNYLVIGTDMTGNSLPTWTKRYAAPVFHGNQTSVLVNHDGTLSMAMSNGGLGRTNQLFNLPGCYTSTSPSGTVNRTPTNMERTRIENSVTPFFYNSFTTAFVSGIDPLEYQCALECNDLAVTLTSQDDGCTAANTGSIQANVSGGTPAFSYLWSNGSSSNPNTNLAGGTYSVVVTDAVGCTASAVSTVGAGGAPITGTVQANTGTVAGTGQVLAPGSVEQVWTPGQGTLVVTPGSFPACSNSAWLAATSYVDDPRSVHYCFCTSDSGGVKLSLNLQVFVGMVLSATIDGIPINVSVGDPIGSFPGNGIFWQGLLEFSAPLPAGTHCVEIQYQQYISGTVLINCCLAYTAEYLVDEACCNAPRMKIEPNFESDKATWTCSPNPANDRILLNHTLYQEGSVNIAVYDMQGKLVLNTRRVFTGGQPLELALDELAGGLYILRTEMNGTFEDLKLMIQR